MPRYVDLESVGRMEPGELPGVAGRSFADGWNSALETLASLPQVDAVPVVRCRDCMYYFAGYASCGLYQAVGKIPPEHFCAEGKTEEQWKKEHPEVKTDGA